MNLDEDRALVTDQYAPPKLKSAQSCVLPPSSQSSGPSSKPRYIPQSSPKRLSSLGLKSRKKSYGRNDYPIKEENGEEEKALLNGDNMAVDKIYFSQSGEKDITIGRQAQNIPPTTKKNKDEYQLRLSAHDSTVPEVQLERNSIILRPKLQHPPKPKPKRSKKNKKKDKPLQLTEAALEGPEAKKNKLTTPFHPENNWRLFWELIVLLVMIIDVIILPLDISFAIFGQTRPFAYISNAILAIDVLVNFNTSYYHHGLLVTKHRKIARHYLRTWFIFDIIAAYPFWTINIAANEGEYSPDQPYLLIQLLRLIKLIKLVKVLHDFKFSIFLKKYKMTSMKIYYLDSLIVLWNLIFILLIISHWCGCIWHFIAAIEISQGEEVNWLNHEGIAQDSVFVRYSYSLYWALQTILTVGYGDITPRTLAEMWFADCCMLFGRGLFAYIITSMWILVNDLRKAKGEINERIYEVNGFLSENSLSKETKARVNSYMRFMYKNEFHEKAAQQRVLADIPRKVRQQISIELKSNILLSNIVFTSNFRADFLVDLSLLLKEQIACPEDVVDKGKLKKNNDNKFYIIDQGRVELRIKSIKTPLKKLKVGASFGEVPFFSNRETRIEAISVTFSRIYSISKKLFLGMLINYPHERESYCLIQDKINLYNDYSDLREKCIICGLEGHNILGCTVLSSGLTSEKARETIKENELDFRKSFIRKGKRHHFQVIQTNLGSYQYFQEEYVQCYSLKRSRRYSLDGISDLQKIREKTDSKSASIIKAKALQHKIKFKIREKRSKSVISTPDNVLKRRDCRCFYCMDMRNIHKTQSGLCDLENNYGYGLNDKDLKSIGLDEDNIFDQVKIFEKYFLHNNVDNVISCINHAGERNQMASELGQAIPGIVFNTIKKSGDCRQMLDIFRKQEAQRTQIEGHS